MSRFTSPTVILNCSWSFLLFTSTLLSLKTGVHVAHGNEDVDVANGHVQGMIEWLRSTEHGYFSEKLEIRRANPEDPDSYFGVFASSDIEEDEFLMQLTQELILSVEDNEEYFDDICKLKEKLMEEAALGEKSKYVLYMNYLKTQKPGQIPSNYSPEGKKLLSAVVGISPWINEDGDVEYFPMFPPKGLLDFREMDCIETPEERNVMELVIQRGFDLAMIPVYDMINHKNGAVNVETTSIRNEEGFQVNALRAIQAGEEIFITYDRCDDCAGVEDTWGTPEIFRDFGFVESYPQRWHFVYEGISFDLEEVSDDDDSTASGTDRILELNWIYDRPADTVSKFLWLEYHKKRLEKVGNAEIMDAKKIKQNAIPKQELENIVQFYIELSEAITIALNAAKENVYCGGYACETRTNQKAEKTNKRRNPPSWAKGLDVDAYQLRTD